MFSEVLVSVNKMKSSKNLYSSTDERNNISVLGEDGVHHLRIYVNQDYKEKGRIHSLFLVNSITVLDERQTRLKLKNQNRKINCIHGEIIR